MDALHCSQHSHITNCRNNNIPLQQQMEAKAHESNCQKWPFVSPQIVKMTPEIYTRNTLSKNSQKLPQKVTILGTNLSK